MALVFADLVQENTSTTGTGTLTLTGAVSTQFQTFAAIGNANTTYYRIISGNDSEVGIGTYSLFGTMLSRDTVLTSIISGTTGTTKITVAAGATVICTYPSNKAVLLDASNNLSLVNPLLVANGGTGVTTSTGTVNTVLSDSPTLTGKVSFNGSTSQIAAILANAAETTNITAAALTGVLPVYLALGAVQYYTAVATGSWTPNISLSSLPTTLNTALAIGQSTTVAFMATQGTTAYFSNALQIDGTAVTPKWQGGTAPTAGNVSGIDVYTYTIVKTAASTYTVLASMTQFK